MSKTRTTETAREPRRSRETSLARRQTTSVQTQRRVPRSGRPAAFDRLVRAAVVVLGGMFGLVLVLDADEEPSRAAPLAAENQSTERAGFSGSDAPAGDEASSVLGGDMWELLDEDDVAEEQQAVDDEPHKLRSSRAAASSGSVEDVFDPAGRSAEAGSILKNGEERDHDSVLSEADAPSREPVPVFQRPALTDSDAPAGKATAFRPLWKDVPAGKARVQVAGGVSEREAAQVAEAAASADAGRSRISSPLNRNRRRPQTTARVSIPLPMELVEAPTGKSRVAVEARGAANGPAEFTLDLHETAATEAPVARENATPLKQHLEQLYAPVMSPARRSSENVDETPLAENNTANISEPPVATAEPEPTWDLAGSAADSPAEPVPALAAGDATQDTEPRAKKTLPRFNLNAVVDVLLGKKPAGSASRRAAGAEKDQAAINSAQVEQAPVEHVWSLQDAPATPREFEVEWTDAAAVPFFDRVIANWPRAEDGTLASLWNGVPAGASRVHKPLTPAESLAASGTAKISRPRQLPAVTDETDEAPGTARISVALSTETPTPVTERVVAQAQPPAPLTEQAVPQADPPTPVKEWVVTQAQPPALPTEQVVAQIQPPAPRKKRVVVQAEPAAAVQTAAQPVPPSPAPGPADRPDTLEYVGFRPIGQLTVDIGAVPGEDPPDLAVAEFETFEPVVLDIFWIDQALTAPIFPFYHQPLYFEDPNAERCGQTWGHLQPLASAAHFYLTIPALPYLIGALPPHEPVESLGDCPWGCRFTFRDGYLPPFSWKGVAAQAAVVTGGILLIP